MKPFKTLRTMEEWENIIILRTLVTHNWNRTKTAETLGICIRNLRGKIFKLKEVGYDIPDNKFEETH